MLCFYDYYNLDIKNPYSEEVEILDPEEALQQYLESVDHVEKAKQQLVDELTAILKEGSNV